jgi:hypothetical protein
MAGIFGILLDQLTYTVSPEYFTQYKFPLYNINPYEFGGDRMTAVVIGFRATWWMGFLIGTGIGCTGFIYENRRQRRWNVFIAILIVFCTTVLMGLTGFFYGEVVEVNDMIDRTLIRNLANPVDFIVVGSIHQHSYVGAFLGMLLGISFLFTQKAKANLLLAKFAT